MSHLLCGALLLAASATHPAALAVDEWHAALRAGNEEKVLGQLAPDVVVFESGGAEMDRAEYAGHHLAADMEFAAGTTTAVESRQVIEAGAAAIVLSRTTTSGTFRGQSVSSRGVETMVMEKSGASWRIRHIHWSSGRSAGAEYAELTARTLAARLRSAKLVVKEQPPVEQPFFSPKAAVLRVGDDELQVYRFPDAAAAEKAAGTVSKEGTTIGTTAVHWMAPPHFYRKGRLIVIHLGSHAELRPELEKLLGAPFAGRP